jgi:hypothetical protein
VDVNRVVIEDQPHFGRKINRNMLLIQDFCVSFFALRQIKVDLALPSIRSIFYKNASYKENKQNSINSAAKIVESCGNDELKKFFTGTKKKIDDLADCFLQAIAFHDKVKRDLFFRPFCLEEIKLF